jgi:hypothetical protein
VACSSCLWYTDPMAKRWKRKCPKATIKKAHRIAEAIKRGGGKQPRSPYAVGMAVATGKVKRRRKKTR